MCRRSFYVALTMVVWVGLAPLITAANAGEVITDDIRLWARQTMTAESGRDFQPAENTVAVLYFHNRTKDPALDFLEMGMTIMLITDLAKLEEIQVVERNRLQALLQELDLGTSGLVRRETAPRVGRLLSAYYLVYGAFKDEGAQTLNLGSDLLDLPQNDLLGTAATSGPLDNLLLMEKQILFEIIRMLRLDLTEAQKKALRRPFTTDIKALEYLVRGIQSSDQGNYNQAAENYQKALDIDPKLKRARMDYKELVDLGLVHGVSTSRPMLRRLQRRTSVNAGPMPDLMTRRFRSEPVSILGLRAVRSAGVDIRWNDNTP